MFASFQNSQRCRSSKRRTFQPSLERLEDRMVPSSGSAHAPSPHTILTGVDMSTMATIIGGYPHSGPTHLYLNFDGGGDVTSAGLPDQAVQETLYRTSEIFAPFNVEVSRLERYGTADTSGDGGTTVFVGINIKTPGYTFTPAENSDYPHLTVGYWHRPNSDGDDIAYVDVGTVPTPAAISRGAAHESGHTFGLTHVRTDKNNGKGPFLLDPAPLPTPATPTAKASPNQGTVSDIMSYTDGNWFFTNQPLPITNYNNNGSTTSINWSMQPHYEDIPLDPTLEIIPSTQNSFAYLETVLGARPAEPGFRVAHADTVDPSRRALYRPMGIDTLPKSIYITHGGTIDRLGDYDVNSWTAPRPETLTVTAQATGTSTLKPVLLVYDDSGKLVLFNDSVTHGSSLAVKEGVRYYFVVGAENGNSTGTYKLDIQEVRPLFVAINSLTDLDPTSHGGFSDTAAVKIGGAEALAWSDNVYYQETALRGAADIEIDVNRYWHGKHISPTLISRKGEWYYDLHDGTGLHDTGYNSTVYTADEVRFELHLDWLAVYGAPPGTSLGQVWTIKLTYDVTGGTIKGVAHGTLAGKDVSLPVSGAPDTPITVSGFGLPDITFTISMDSLASSYRVSSSSSDSIIKYYPPGLTSLLTGMSWYTPSGTTPLPFGWEMSKPPSLAPWLADLVAKVPPSLLGTTRRRDAVFAMGPIEHSGASSKLPATFTRKPGPRSEYEVLLSQDDLFDLGVVWQIPHLRH